MVTMVSCSPKKLIKYTKKIKYILFSEVNQILIFPSYFN